MSATAFSGVFPIDVPLPGTKMRLRDTSGPDGRRTYAVLRDGDQAVPVPDPRITGAIVSIGRVGAGEVTVLDLPASGWSAGTSVRRGFKFKSRSGAVVSARLVEGSSIRISVRGDAAYPLGGTPQGGVGIIIDVGGVRFCGFFGGIITKDDGERFVARTAPAPAGCPILGTTTTTSTTSSTTTSTSSTTSTSTSSTTTTTLPSGTYRMSCFFCSVSNNVLTCDCVAGGENSFFCESIPPPTSFCPASSLQLPCASDIANCDGHLKCGGCASCGTFPTCAGSCPAFQICIPGAGQTCRCLSFG